MDIFNLQASMPTRRPFCFSIVSSRRSIPSGKVPGDGVVGCAEEHRCGGEGAGSDWFLQFRFRVLCAKSEDLFVFFYFSWVLYVNCISTDEMI
jgi:hypothetical protein